MSTTETAGQELLVGLDDGVLTLEINRPESRNSLTAEVVDGLRAQIDRAAADDAVRCVVLTGRGKAFSSGQAVSRGPRTITTEEILRDHYNPLVRSILELDKPVVAAINGVAAGAAASISLACDFRIMAEEARYAFLFVRIGLVPDAGGSWLLPRLVGHAAATELMMLGGDVPSAEAYRLGLANRVVPLADLPSAVAELTGRLAHGPLAQSLVKRQLRSSRTATLDEQFAVEIEAQVTAAASADYVEGVAAFAEKRPARFQGR
jgi:2-(1,2-epoxy-1,2-dihydrophenyl)acetyl-CoA isomerase